MPTRHQRALPLPTPSSWCAQARRCDDAAVARCHQALLDDILARAIDEQDPGVTVPQLTVHAVREAGRASGPRARGVTVAIDIGGGLTDHAAAIA